MTGRVMTLPRRDAPVAPPPRYRRRLTEPVAVFLVGLRRSQNLVLYTGLGTLLLVVGKLILVDLSMVDEIWRILLFLGFGGLFLVLSYYLQSWLRRRPDPARGAP